MHFKSLLKIAQQLILIFITISQSFTYCKKNNDLFYIGGFIAKKMVAKMKSIECANELYHSFCQEHAIKSKTNLPSCSPINDNVFVQSSRLIKIMQATDKLVRETLIERQDASK